MKKNIRTIAAALSLIFIVGLLPMTVLAVEEQDVLPVVDVVDEAQDKESEQEELQEEDLPQGEKEDVDTDVPVDAEGPADVEQSADAATLALTQSAEVIVSGAYLENVRYGDVGAAIAAANGADAEITIYGSVVWDDRAKPNEPSDEYWAAGQSVTVLGGDESAELRFKSQEGPYYQTDPEQKNYRLHMNGPLTIDDVGVKAVDYNTTYLLAGGYPLTMGYGVSRIDGSNWINVYGGADGIDVESAELNLLGGSYVRVFAGGRNSGGVTGDSGVTIGSGAYATAVYGSGLKGDMDGDVSLNVAGGALYVFGAYRASVAGNVEITVSGEVNSVTGGGLLSRIEGDVTINVPAGGEVESLSGGGNNTGNAFLIKDGGSWGGEQDNEPASPDHELMSVGNADITVEGLASGVTGGGFGGDVRGNTSITVSGTVNHIQGGGYNDGNVLGSTYVTVSGDVETEQISGVSLNGVIYGAGFMSYVAGDTHVTLTETGTAYTVLGGGDDGYVQGASYVEINGTVKQFETFKLPMTIDEFRYGPHDREIRYSGNVFGGSYIDQFGYEEGSVQGGTHVTIGESAQIDCSVYGGSLYGNSGSTSVIVNGGTIGGAVYGGSWLPDGDGVGLLGVVDGNASVVLNGDVNVSAVYGGSHAGTVTGTATVELRGSSHADTIYGAGRNQTSLQFTDHAFDPVLASVGGSSVILKGNASVETVYGYELLNDESNATGPSTVTFDGNTSAVKQIINTSAVAVTNTSVVTIDNEGKDNEQMVNVSDLSVTGKSKIILPADAHVLGSYTGDTAEQKGTLVLSAGKGLTAEKTVTGLTDVSIVDTGAVKPAEAQVYVISKLGSTTTDGDFTWVDRREGLAMEWKANDDQTSQWWLVKYTEPTSPPVDPGTPGVTTYKITVKYEKLNGDSLADDYTVRKDAGSKYDVSAQAAKAIKGYTIDRVDGTVEGTLRGNVTVTVYYKQNATDTPDEPETENPGEEPPLTNLPEVEIPGEDTPLAPLPGEEGDVVVVDPEIPMGSLPQTGTGRSVDPAVTLGFLALAGSLAMAGLTVGMKKRKDGEAAE